MLKNSVERFNNLVSSYEDLITLIEIGNEEDDETILEEVKQLKQQFLEEYENIKIATLLTGEYDKNNAILTLHSGAGGTEEKMMKVF